VGKQTAHERQIAQPDDSGEHAPFVVANEACQQVGFAVVQANHGADVAVAERW
jgi:hypothetical protein